MATEHVLRLRITKAAEAAQRAVAREDTRAYEQARAAYEAADAALRVLEKERNMKAIEELEMSATPENGEAVLSYSAIVDSGVPFSVMKARGWVDMPDRAGMRLPAKPPHLSVVPPPPEDEAG